MGNPFMTFGGLTILAIVFWVLRLILAMNARGSGAKIARIGDLDSHLSFDERIAERMRELEAERADAGASKPPQGFGRRGA